MLKMTRNVSERIKKSHVCDISSRCRQRSPDMHSTSLCCTPRCVPPASSAMLISDSASTFVCSVFDRGSERLERKRMMCTSTLSSQIETAPLAEENSSSDARLTRSTSRKSTSTMWASVLSAVLRRSGDARGWQLTRWQTWNISAMCWSLSSTPASHRSASAVSSSNFNSTISSTQTSVSSNRQCVIAFEIKSTALAAPAQSRVMMSYMRNLCKLLSAAPVM
mmetsp:Transcript_7956/g.26038  ORF Transcript_7956/g.26038 Transcript_7956/m.26038 type:complete len:222 (+) Transcript_7956:818-1483(+)